MTGESRGDGAALLPRRILVAVEGSEPSLKESSMRAARYALELSAIANADLIGVCVIQIPEYIEEHTKASLRDELTTKSRKTLDEIKEMASSTKVRFRSEVVETSGGIATEICEFSSRAGADLIVLGTRAATSALTKMMLGSVASGVAGNASCPVLVVR